MELQFRKRGLSRESRHRLTMGILIFIAALAFFYLIFNVHHTEHAEAMDTPTLPVVSFEAYGTEVNPLKGYTTQMDAAYMRGTIIPVDSTMEIPLTVTTYDSDVSDMKYTLQAADSSKKITSGDVSLSSGKNDMQGKITLKKDAIEADREYLLTLTVNADGRKVYYYTRIISADDWHAQDCLQFAQYFHDTALSDSYADLEQYLESDDPSAVTTTSLSDVDLYSSTSQIGWGGFDGKPVGDVDVSFTDINSSYSTLEFDYTMRRKEADGSYGYYPVSEYFRIRYTANRMYLMDYGRHMEQISGKGQVSIDDSKLDIGVADQLSYLSNETGTIVSYVQAGDLWEYDQQTHTLHQIFSFRGKNKTDPRIDTGSYGIRVLNVDETGTMDYVVYGYMPAGTHEGRVGIGLFHYDSTTGHNTEQVFINSSKSDQVLQAGFSELLYLSGSRQFYLVIGGTLVDINLQDNTMTESKTGLGLDQYTASRSGRYLAYINKDNSDTKIHIQDLENGKLSTIQAEAGTTLRPLAFMDEDLIYGVVRDSDVAADAAGNKVYPMYEIRIVSVADKNQVIKTYSNEGSYILDASLNGSTLTMDLATRDGNTYVSSGTDTIKNSFGETNNAVSVSEKSDDVKGLTTEISMADLGSGQEKASVKYETAGITNPDADDAVTVRTTRQDDQYFVYVGSRVVLATENLNDAISRADSEMGTVVNNSQKNIWSRSRAAYRNAMGGFKISSADAEADTRVKAISAMLGREGHDVDVSKEFADGGTPISVLEKEMKKATVLDLGGCSLTQVLYYVSIGNPVYALNGDGTAVLITGYTASNVNIYNPATGKTSSQSIDAAAAQFAAAGNAFLSYVD